MKKTYSLSFRILLLVLFTAFYQSLSAQAWIWVKSYGGSDKDKGRSLGVDQFGNQYLSGWFTDVMTLGSTTLQASGNSGDEDIFITKLDVNGNPIWAHSMGNGFFNHDDYPYGMSVNADGWSATTGKCFKYLKLDNGDSIPAFGDNDIFLVSYDPDGNLNWAKVGGGPGSDLGTATYVDNSGNIYCVGNFKGTINFFGDTTLNYPIGRHIYCAKYAVTGELLWIKVWDSASSINVRDMEVDANGNIYMSGDFDQQMMFDSWILNSNGDFDGFIVKLDPVGNVLWANSFGSTVDTSFESAATMAVDVAGNCYVASTFSMNCQFGSNVLETNDARNIAIAAYDAAGGFVWANVFRGGPEARFSPSTLNLVAEESILLVGAFGGIDTIGNIVLKPTGTDALKRDGFIISLNPLGEVNWAIHMGGSDHDAAYGLACNNSAFCYATGNYRWEAQFGTTNLVATGESDLWVAKFEKNTITGTSPVVNSHALQAFHVFPNPFTNDVEVSIPQNTEELTVYNVIGQVVLQHETGKSESQVSLDLNETPVGIYTIRVKGDYGITCAKIEKQY